MTENNFILTEQLSHLNILRLFVGSDEFFFRFVGSFMVLVLFQKLHFIINNFIENYSNLILNAFNVQSFFDKDFLSNLQHFCNFCYFTEGVLAINSHILSLQISHLPKNSTEIAQKCNNKQNC